MIAPVDTPLRCGLVLFSDVLCMKPAVKAVVASQSCGCSPTAYACDDHDQPAIYAGTCQQCGAECSSSYETRPINEGDLPDEPDQQIVGRWADGSVALP